MRGSIDGETDLDINIIEISRRPTARGTARVAAGVGVLAAGTAAIAGLPLTGLGCAATATALAGFPCKRRNLPRPATSSSASPLSPLSRNKSQRAACTPFHNLLRNSKPLRL